MKLSEITLTVSKHPEAPNKFPEDVVSFFLASDKVTLYSIEPNEKGRENFHGYKVLGKARIKNSETAAILADLKKSLTDKNGGALCFNPHHALRAAASGHTYDIVICYLCGEVLTYGMDSTPTANALTGNEIAGSPSVINDIAEKHGLPKPMVLIRTERVIKAAEDDETHWMSAMPLSLRPLWHASSRRDLMAMRDALAQEYPSAKQQILALFSWYGSSHSPWRESSWGYEEVPARLLEDYSFTAVLSEAQSSQLTDHELEGAARFFATYYLRSQDIHNRQALKDAIARYSQDTDRWLRAMPSSIRPLWKDEMWYYQGGFRLSVPDHTLMQQALAEEFPDNNARIRVLFDWYGSGAGVKRNAAGYENIVDRLLCDFTTPELAQALQSTLTQQQLDGATRLFAHWEYQRNRKGEVGQLPPR